MNILKTPLAVVLVIAAGLVTILVAVEYFILGLILMPPVIISASLVVLSLASRKWPTTIAGISILISILVPIGAVLGFLNGDLHIAIPIFDVLLFSWVAATGVNTLMTRQAQQVSIGD
jgi:hypothetical protein